MSDVYDIRFARASCADKKATTISEANSKTYWSVNKANDDNIMATFLNGRLVSVRLMTIFTHKEDTPSVD